MVRSIAQPPANQMKDALLASRVLQILQEPPTVRTVYPPREAAVVRLRMLMNSRLVKSTMPSAPVLASKPAIQTSVGSAAPQKRHRQNYATGKTMTATA